MSGAGKTYTLAGQAGSSKTPSIQGIQDLAIGDLLRLAKESFEVRLTALEIYNESIQDEGLRPSLNWPLDGWNSAKRMVSDDKLMIKLDEGFDEI